MTANQAYKKSGSTLPFSTWLAMQKKKGTIVSGEEIKESNFIKDQDLNATGITLGQGTILGIPEQTFIIGTIVLIVAVTAGILIYRHNKKAHG